MITIGKLAEASGCGIEAVRFYEREGILPIPQRRGRYRLYDADDVVRVRFVRRARDLGFGLDVVRKLLLLTDGGGDCDDARQLAETNLASVRAKIVDLQRMETVLAQTVVACKDGHAPNCPLLVALGSSGDIA